VRLNGVLFFPVTPFGPDGEPNLDVLAAHVDAGVHAGAGAVFVACGTGEFHALSAAEHDLVVRQTVEVVDGRLSVIAGVGGPLGLALELARRSEAQGLDGLLVLPPYLVGGTQAGLVEYVRQIAGSTDLPLIAYSRGNAVLDVASARSVAALPNVIGLKDGHGDLELLRSVIAGVSEVRDDFLYFNGLSTAEFFMPDNRELGVELYSSASFAFAQEIALGFYWAFQARHDDRVAEYMSKFYEPLVALRDEVPGYAIALIKAGAVLRGTPVGSVRAPLVDPTPEHLERLAAILAAGLEISEGPEVAVSAEVAQ
jgi:5-dehydro-4-deoxyglucarate dehydratase